MPMHPNWPLHIFIESLNSGIKNTLGITKAFSVISGVLKVNEFTKMKHSVIYIGMRTDVGIKAGYKYHD